MPDCSLQKERNDGLTDLELRFVEAYCGVAGRKMEAAAIAAGYKCPRQQASLVLARIGVQEAIRAKTLEIMQDTGVTVQQIQANAQELIDFGRNHNKPEVLAKGNEQLGRTIGCFSDKVIHEDVKAEEIKASERAELEAIARQRTIPIRGA